MIHPEPCPLPTEITLKGCQDSTTYDLSEIYMESLGRILQLNVHLRNVCPRKRVALGVILTEVDQEGMEYPRGMKTITVPAHYKSFCSDVFVKGIKFVLPEDLDVSGGSFFSICNSRTFKARVLTNYIDSDFECTDLMK